MSLPCFCVLVESQLRPVVNLNRDFVMWGRKCAKTTGASGPFPDGGRTESWVPVSVSAPVGCAFTF